MSNFLEHQTSPRITNVISTITVLICLPLLILGVFRSFEVLTRAFGKPADIVINTDIQLDNIQTDYMRAFAQGGEEAKDMLAPVVNTIIPLKPKIIRIDHIYDYHNVVSRAGDGSLRFDFSRLEQAVSTILQTGATPLLSLSYMPQAIALNGIIINPPNNWNEWSLVVQKTIEHFSGKKNMNIPNMYYEVWNEPDLEQFGKWKLSGTKNYITLYQYAAKGAQNASNVNQFSLGGPSTTGLYKNWIFGLVQSGARVDFLSWHSYIPNPKQFALDQTDIGTWLAPYPQFAFLPKLITEFGFTGSKDPRYGTMYGAAYTAQVFRHTVIGKPTYLFTFQLKDGPNQTDGWGLIGHESNGKTVTPRYALFPLIDAMNGTRLELTGEGTWVSALASVRDSTIRVLLINFNYQGSKAETVPVTFNRLPPGQYTYREQFLLGRNVQFTETVTSNTPLKKQIYMPANSVVLLEVIPLSQAPSNSNEQ